LTASNVELDADIERASASIDAFEKQERDTRKRYAELESEMSTLEAELVGMKERGDHFEAAHENELSRYALHVAACEEETSALQKSLEDQLVQVTTKTVQIRDGKNPGWKPCLAIIDCSRLKHVRTDSLCPP
jgi:chromosome segregation ATPase